MKILPTMNSGVVLMHEDGTFEMAPFQVFRSATGMTVIRIGANAFYFEENGRFDGGECNMGETSEVDPAYTAKVAAAYGAEKANQGKPPVEPYFEPGTAGHEAETRMWADASFQKAEQTRAKDNTVYAATVGRKKGPSA